MPPPSSWVFHSQFSMISLPPAWPGSQKRKYRTFYFSTGLQSNQWGKKKKKRMISVCSSFSKCSQHTNSSHMASELSQPFRVRQDLKTTSNSQEMDFWPSLEMSNEAFVMTDWPTRIQLVSAPLLHPEGWEGRERLKTHWFKWPCWAILCLVP